MKKIRKTKEISDWRQLRSDWTRTQRKSLNEKEKKHLVFSHRRRWAGCCTDRLVKNTDDGGRGVVQTASLKSLNWINFKTHNLKAKCFLVI